MFPIATSLRATFRRGYHVSDLMADVSAGAVVSLIALPLSMALAIAVGLPPHHGIYTAIVAGLFAALLGGSPTQVSGPTAAFVVVLIPIVMEHGLRGLVIAQLMAGIMILLMGSFRLGKLIQFIPYPVITGFTAGIAVVLAVMCLNDLLGLKLGQLQGNFFEKATIIFHKIPDLSWQEVSISVTTLAVLLLWNRWIKKVPGTIIAVIVASLLAVSFKQFGIEVATIGSIFSYVDNAGTIQQGIPNMLPPFYWPTTQPGQLLTIPTLAELKVLLLPAIVIAILAGLESLLSATVADSLAGTRHHPNGELIGIGFANIATAFVGGIPATGAIARTTANIRSGARSPIASASHALFILAYVLIAAKWISYMPMASLAAILLITAYHMSHYRQCIRVIRTAHWSDALVLIGCFSLTVIKDMVFGVAFGIVLAVILFIKRMMDITRRQFFSANQLISVHKIPVPEGVKVLRIQGPLFFGTATSALESTNFPDEIHTILLVMTQVPTLDMTALIALEEFINYHQKHGIQVGLCGKKRLLQMVQKALFTENPLHYFTRLEDALNAMHRQPLIEASPL